MSVLLLCRTGDAAGLAELVDEGGRCLIGRTPACDLVLLDPQLSREHAALAARPDGCVEVEDLGSRNGTRLNDEALAPGVPRRAEHLDRVGLGSVEFLVIDLDRVPATETVAAHLVDSDGARIPLQMDTVTLGRDERNDLIVDSEGVADVHLHLQLAASGLHAWSETGSTLVVNGRAARQADLKDGDRVRLGTRLEFGIELFAGSGPAPDVAREETEASDDEFVAVDPEKPTTELADLEESVRRARELHRRRLADSAAAQADSTGGMDARPSGQIRSRQVSRNWPFRNVDAQTVRREVAFRLHHQSVDEGDESVLLREGRHLVGRHPGCRVALGDTSVSREHAELIVGPEGIRIRDLGSTNGVHVAGERVDEVVVKAGARVRFGDVETWFEEI